MAESSHFLHSKRNILLTLAIVLISILLFYIFFLAKVFIRRTDPLPYIWPSDHNFTIHQYIKTYPSRNVLLISGPYKTGKSALLINLTNELRQKGELVFHFDFKKIRSEHDANGFCQLAILEALMFYNNSHIYRLISPIDFQNSYSVDIFFDSLENLHITTPVVIVRGINQLKKYAPQIFEAAYSRLKRRDQYQDNVPVIIETRNSLYRTQYLPSFFKILEIDEIEDPYSSLGSGLHAFSSSELKKIKSAIGFHGGPIDSIFEGVRKSNNIDEAISQEVERINKTVSKYRVDAPIIQKICDSKEKPIQIGKGDLDDIVPLLQKGLVYITDDYKLKASNHAVWKSLCY
ncbi:hypothetical protein M9Y10_020192 [Tritrichomonas musculus]|uniref:Uncharacterized protein n=1 Tax=Tritrichomonas musculus TaxID=1915356 RepID=A0ABR2HFH0_9EUKA